MPFNLSVLKPLLVQPWRYINGVDGANETLTGAFILLDEAQLTYMRETLTNAQKTTLESWLWRVTETSAAMWNVTMWSGQTSAVYVRVPANIWANATSLPPAQVKTFFRELYQD